MHQLGSRKTSFILRYTAQTGTLYQKHDSSAFRYGASPRIVRCVFILTSPLFDKQPTTSRIFDGLEDSITIQHNSLQKGFEALMWFQRSKMKNFYNPLINLRLVLAFVHGCTMCFMGHLHVVIISLIGRDKRPYLWRIKGVEP